MASPTTRAGPHRWSKCCAPAWRKHRAPKPSSSWAGSASPTASFGERAARRGRGLKKKGLRSGDRVAIRLPNGLHWCLAFFGAQLAGAVVVPVNTRFTEPEVAYVLSDSGAAFTFLPGQPLPDGAPFVTTHWAPRDVAAIFYTSGTTGFPKGAMITNEGLLANTETCRRIMHLPTDGSVRNLISVPLFHVTGCNSQLLPTCEAGGTTVIMPAFEVPGRSSPRSALSASICWSPCPPYIGLP